AIVSDNYSDSQTINLEESGSKEDSSHQSASGGSGASSSEIKDLMEENKRLKRQIEDLQKLLNEKAAVSS
ncbi:UNVERIFIED_CONTAM: hypothetical protein HDU68_005521, partial [Siphonaria sp. JEL0065]